MQSRTACAPLVSARASHVRGHELWEGGHDELLAQRIVVQAQLPVRVERRPGEDERLEVRREPRRFVSHVNDARDPPPICGGGGFAWCWG
jgi:hypothetical protein